VIYQQRNELLESAEIAETIGAMREGVLHDLVSEYIPPHSMEEQWDVAGLEAALAAEYQLHLPLQAWLTDNKQLDENGLRLKTVEAADMQYQAKVAAAGAGLFHGYERILMLSSLDQHWREHLAALDHLRQGIHLRGYAQKNPKQEYKREAFELFSTMLDAIKRDVTQTLMNVQIRSEEDVEAVEPAHAPSNVQYHHADYEEALAAPAENAAVETQPFVRNSVKIGRNDLCPCGSGKKYKQCHGKLN
jgi:preprotein translocase subunit SecA